MHLLMGVKELFDKVFLEEKVRVLGTRMYRVASALLRTDADRQDAMQQALQRAWEKRHSLRDTSKFDGWLMRILINECRNIQRGQHRLVPMDQLPDSPTPAPDLDLQDAVERLPDKQRLCVVLHYLEGLPIQEIAAMLRLPQSTVRGRLMQARKALKLQLTAGEEDNHAT